jgi:hypothetical protein
MKKRPLSLTIISWIFVAAGVVGLAYHLSEFKALHPFPSDVVWVFLLRLMAIVCGAFMLRANNWARWLSVAWLAYHVILSGFHSLQEFVMHSLLLAVFAYFLFRPEATRYFLPARTEAP